MVVFKGLLECELFFPLHPFLQASASSYELEVNRFTPKTYYHINSFITLSYSFGVEPEVSTFIKYHKITRKPKGCFYFFGPQGGTTLKYQFVFQCPRSFKRWQHEFFFFRLDKTWGLQSSWKVGQVSDVNHPHRLLKEDLTHLIMEFSTIS